MVLNWLFPDDFRDLTSMIPSATCSVSPSELSCAVMANGVTVSGFTEHSSVTIDLLNVTNPSTTTGSFKVQVTYNNALIIDAPYPDNLPW